MLLGKLELTEQTEMAFSIDVYGTTEQTQNIRLVIEGPEFDIGCRCKVANGEVTATVPKLKGVIAAGVYEARLEVQVGDKIFVPLKEQIELNPLVEFDIKTKKVEPIKEGVKVTVKNHMVAEDSKPKTSMSGIEKNIQKAIAEGFEVSQVGDNYIAKKGDTYVGIINESKILMAKKGYTSLTDLIDSFNK
jgi:hypothetical protein